MHCRRLFVAAALFLGTVHAADAVAVAAMAPGDMITALATALTTGRTEPVKPWLTTKGLSDVQSLAAAEAANHALAAIGAPCPARLFGRQEQPGRTILSLTMACTHGTVFWRITFDDATGMIDAVVVQQPLQPLGSSGPAVSAAPSARHHAYTHRGPPSGVGQAAPQPSVAPAPPPGPAPAPPRPTPPPVVADSRPIPSAAADTTTAAERTVEMLLATTRKTDTRDALRFTADRADGLTFGIVRVHVPEDHKAGQVERPYRLSLAGFTIYEEKLDEKKHFVVTGARLISEDDFDRFATGDPDKTALVFVHGFNNTFEDSAYRFAQILYDLHYKHPAILFSWASKGSVVDYLYDKDSAEIARDRFAQLIRTLRARGVEKIEVIAHSMGNYLAVAALAASAESTTPDAVDQLIMAAPDMARDYLMQEVPKLRQVAQGMTLYACATDRALEASKEAAGGVPRAGDVPSDGPLVVAGIDTIDMSALGADWFGLNHDVFASNRSVMDDIAALLGGRGHPPRLAAMVGMPAGTTPPQFWRFQAP